MQSVKSAMALGDKTTPKLVARHNLDKSVVRFRAVVRNKKREVIENCQTWPKIIR